MFNKLNESKMQSVTIKIISYSRLDRRSVWSGICPLVAVSPVVPVEYKFVNR